MGLIVGVILNLINQGSEIVGLQFGQINYPKFFLTFMVPFSVSIYSSTTTKLKFFTGEFAFIDAELICKSCKKSKQKVKKGERVKDCPECPPGKARWKIIRLLNI